MPDSVDRQQCQDITCGLGGHERCREEAPKTLEQHLWDLSYEMAREVRQEVSDE